MSKMAALTATSRQSSGKSGEEKRRRKKKKRMKSLNYDKTEAF
jgi:hypothetical protein